MHIPKEQRVPLTLNVYGYWQTEPYEPPEVEDVGCWSTCRDYRFVKLLDISLGSHSAQRSRQYLYVPGVHAAQGLRAFASAGHLSDRSQTRSGSGSGHRRVGVQRRREPSHVSDALVPVVVDSSASASMDAWCSKETLKYSSVLGRKHRRRRPNEKRMYATLLLSCTYAISARFRR